MVARVYKQKFLGSKPGYGGVMKGIQLPLPLWYARKS